MENFFLLLDKYPFEALCTACFIYGILDRVIRRRTTSDYDDDDD